MSVAYTNAAGYNVGYTATLPGGGVFRREVVRDPAFPDRILACTNYSGTTAVTGFEYAYDLLGRPVRRNDDAFAYDTRGQVVGMVRPLNANHSETNTYAYDLAGNRTASSDHPLGTCSWTANALNQYESSIDVYQYDADGNLVWIAEPAGLSGNVNLWDAENRMVACTNEMLDARYAYDWRSRRASSSHSLNGVPGDRAFPVYDGWNIVHERREYWDGGWVRDSDIDFFWGPDLSGTLQGAGGVGGLVAVSIAGQYYFPCYDNLGNVVAYMDEGGTKVASYTYDAFGFTLSASGSMRDTFPHRFSTKWQDNYTGLSDYGYRWYWPDIGRWMNRDPIGEEGGENLYGFCGNNGVFSIDLFGLSQPNNSPSGSLVDIKTGVRDFGVIVYFTHTTNFRYLNLAGNQGHRIAHFLTCHSKVLKYQNDWKTRIGMLHSSTMTYNCISKKWTGSYATSKLFREGEK